MVEAVRRVDSNLFSCFRSNCCPKNFQVWETLENTCPRHFYTVPLRPRTCNHSPCSDAILTIPGDMRNEREFTNERFERFHLVSSISLHNVHESVNAGKLLQSYPVHAFVPFRLKIRRGRLSFRLQCSIALPCRRPDLVLSMSPAKNIQKT